MAEKVTWFKEKKKKFLNRKVFLLILIIVPIFFILKSNSLDYEHIKGFFLFEGDNDEYYCFGEVYERNPDYFSCHLWMLTLNSMGEKQNIHFFGEKSGQERLRNVIQTQDGDFVIISDLPSSSVHIMKVDIEGKIEWEDYKYGNKSDPNALAVGESENGNIGFLWKNSIEYNTSQILFSLYDHTGKLISTKSSIKYGFQKNSMLEYSQTNLVYSGKFNYWLYYGPIQRVYFAENGESSEVLPKLNEGARHFKMMPINFRGTTHYAYIYYNYKTNWDSFSAFFIEIRNVDEEVVVSYFNRQYQSHAFDFVNDSQIVTSFLKPTVNETCFLFLTVNLDNGEMIFFPYTTPNSFSYEGYTHSALSIQDILFTKSNSYVAVGIKDVIAAKGHGAVDENLVVLKFNSNYELIWEIEYTPSDFVLFYS
jgi:hypothetical protein